MNEQINQTKPNQTYNMNRNSTPPFQYITDTISLYVTDIMVLLLYLLRVLRSLVCFSFLPFPNTVL